MIYKDTEKTYCEKLNSEKTIKKPTKERTDKWRVVSSEVYCIECNVEIESGTYQSIKLKRYKSIVYINALSFNRFLLDFSQGQCLFQKGSMHSL